MNKKKVLLSLGVALTSVFIADNCELIASKPEKAYLFSYCSGKNGGGNGLHFAWSTDQFQWFEIGPEYSFIKSDYGTWGGGKKMHTPYLFREQAGKWHCVWSVNNHDNTFAYASSDNLVDWKPQSYPYMEVNSCVLNPVLSKEGNNYKIS